MSYGPTKTVIHAGDTSARTPVPATIGGMAAAIEEIAADTGLFALRAAVEAVCVGSDGTGSAALSGQVAALAREADLASRGLAAAVVEAREGRGRVDSAPTSAPLRSLAGALLRRAEALHGDIQRLAAAARDA